MSYFKAENAYSLKSGQRWEAEARDAETEARRRRRAQADRLSTPFEALKGELKRVGLAVGNLGIAQRKMAVICCVCSAHII